MPRNPCASQGFGATCVIHNQTPTCFSSAEPLRASIRVHADGAVWCARCRQQTHHYSKNGCVARRQPTARDASTKIQRRRRCGEARRTTACQSVECARVPEGARTCGEAVRVRRGALVGSSAEVPRTRICARDRIGVARPMQTANDENTGW